MQTALVYDRVNKWGGAERVLLALHEIFPQAPLFTSVYDPEKAAWAKNITVKTSFLQKFPHTKSHHEFYPYLMPIAFERFSFDEFDLVISITSESAKGIITKPHTKHICYCLTPTRYLWSGHDEYFKSKILRTVSAPAVYYLRKWDKLAASRPDIMIAASHEVRKRIKKYYDLDSEVIYPPLTLGNNDINPKSYILNPKPYFLVVSRLVGYKRIDLAIQACNVLKFRLKIIGSGKEEKKLKKLAGPTIEFVGNVSDTELINAYRNCRALLFPGMEDFGLTVIEAQRFYKPVIAFRGGGALETIIEGKTGLFFDRQSKDSLIESLQKFCFITFDKTSYEVQTEKFSSNKFKENILTLVDKLI